MVQNKISALQISPEDFSFRTNFSHENLDLRKDDSRSFLSLDKSVLFFDEDR